MIKIGILGYGNLGKGVELAIRDNSDMELVAIFTRRNPGIIKPHCSQTIVEPLDKIEFYKGKIDILILCGGSATDLPIQTPLYAKDFCVIDSYDNHKKIEEHYRNVDSQLKKSSLTGIISLGWDPGLFSLCRLLGEAILPNGGDYTFWGKGVSQGHSDAIRRIDGVKDAKQYTIPIKNSVDLVRKGLNPKFEANEMHERHCYVVIDDESKKDVIENKIKNIPNYFLGYNTYVNFITALDFAKNHSQFPHGGFIIRTGKTGISYENNHSMEFNLKLDSNPEFTGSVLLCYARACYRMYLDKKYGCFTIYDIPPRYIIRSNKNIFEML